MLSDVKKFYSEQQFKNEFKISQKKIIFDIFVPVLTISYYISEPFSILFTIPKSRKNKISNIFR